MLTPQDVANLWRMALSSSILMLACAKVSPSLAALPDEFLLFSRPAGAVLALYALALVRDEDWRHLK